jgi:hypothetical protein
VRSFSPLLISPLTLESAIVVSPDLVDLMVFSAPDEPVRPHAAKKTEENAIANDMTIFLIFTDKPPEHFESVRRKRFRLAPANLAAHRC